MAEQLALFDLEPVPDAGRSLLGVYGITNPMVVDLLNRRPDLLAETPSEWRADPESFAYPPFCNANCTYVIDASVSHDGDGPGDIRILRGECGHKGVFRWIDGQPAWVCYEDGHDSGKPNVKFIERDPPQLCDDADLDLWEMLGRALEGASADLVFDEGRWCLR